MGWLGGGALVVAKFWGKLKVVLPALKLLPMVLKTGGSMLLTVGVYAGMWGWRYALGFVLLLFVHECGHLLVARRFGLPVGAPVFIPFMGAFIALKESPRNAWMEAWVGIGGPLLGSAGALLCHVVGVWMGWPLFVALAWTGYFLNLFNLTPVGQLDGGRIVSAISPWLWLVGFGVLGWMLWERPQSFLLWVILVLAVPRVWSLFRRRDAEEARYYECTGSQRMVMGFLYFGLIAALATGMHLSGVGAR